MTMEDHKQNAIKAIEAELDTVMNTPISKKHNKQKKETSIAYWQEKLAQAKLQVLSEVAIQCKRENEETKQ